MLNNSPNRLAWILALSLHALLFTLVFWHFASKDVSQIPLQPDVDIIKAVAVSPAQLAQHQAAKQADLDRQRQEQAEKQRQQAEAAQKQAQALKMQQQKAAEQAAAKQKAAQLAQKQAQQKAEAEQTALAAKQEMAQQAQAQQKQAAVKKQQAAKKAQADLQQDLAQQAAQEKTQQDSVQKQAAAKQQADKKSQEATQKLKLAQQKELDAQMAAEQKSLTAARTAQQQSEIDKYKALIEHSISQNWVVPIGSNRDLSCELLIRVGNGGVVQSVEVARSSGDVALDNSARTAVFKASPLPVPADADLFNQFRELHLKVKPEDVQGA